MVQPLFIRKDKKKKCIKCSRISLISNVSIKIAHQPDSYGTVHRFWLNASICRALILLEILYPEKKDLFLPSSWSTSILVESSKDIIPHPLVHPEASKPWWQRFGVPRDSRERAASPASPSPKAAKWLGTARSRRRVVGVCSSSPTSASKTMNYQKKKIYLKIRLHEQTLTTTRIWCAHRQEETCLALQKLRERELA